MDSERNEQIQQMTESLFNMQKLLIAAKFEGKKADSKKVDKEKSDFRRVGKETFRELYGYYNTES